MLTDEHKENLRFTTAYGKGSREVVQRLNNFCKVS